MLAINQSKSPKYLQRQNHSSGNSRFSSLWANKTRRHTFTNNVDETIINHSHCFSHSKATTDDAAIREVVCLFTLVLSYLCVLPSPQPTRTITNHTENIPHSVLTLIFPERVAEIRQSPTEHATLWIAFHHCKQNSTQQASEEHVLSANLHMLSPTTTDASRRFTNTDTRNEGKHAKYSPARTLLRAGKTSTRWPREIFPSLNILQTS